MDFAIGENRVLLEHKFVQQNSKRIRIVGLEVSARGGLKIGMVKIWHFRPIY